MTGHLCDPFRTWRGAAVVAAAGLVVAGLADRAEAQLDFNESQRAEIVHRDGIHVLPVQGNVYMVHLDQGDLNLTVQVGAQGLLLVDTGPADLAEPLLATLQELFADKPVRYIINTHVHPDHAGGNEAIIKALRGDESEEGGGGGGGNANAVRVIAHENTLNRMNGAIEGEPEWPLDALPTSSFFTGKKKLYFNGEPIEIIYVPNAHTDGDVMVFFRRSDVISAGDVYAVDRYPVIDAARDGSIQGVLDGLNQILDITVPEFNQQGGTRVIPGHGRLSNESDVDDYRNWMTIIRDRVRMMVRKGMTLEQVKAAHPSMDFDPVFEMPSWTPDMFIEAVYNDLSGSAASTR